MALPERSEIVALLRQLDDPTWVEYPNTFDYSAEQRRFRSLVSDLERRFDCTCTASAGLEVQDASFLGHLVIPASATTEGIEIFVRVSNFGGLALLGAERPGCYDDAETMQLIAEVDLRAVLDARAALKYVPLLEDVLCTEYDGVWDALRTYRDGSHPANWFTRYFDYL